MSTKPTQVATWESSKSNESAPTSGQITDGYATAAVPSAQTWNYVHRVAGEWEQYLADGSFTGGVTIDDLTVTGDTTLDGAATIDSTLEVVGNATFDAHVYTPLNHSRLRFTEGDTSETTVSSTALVTSGTSWTWDAWPFGSEGDWFSTLEIFATAATVGDTITWQLLRYVTPDSGAIPASTTIATGSFVVAASTALGYLASIGSPSMANEPLGSHESYILTLQGTHSGVHLDGGILIGVSRPPAV